MKRSDLIIALATATLICGCKPTYRADNTVSEAVSSVSQQTAPSTASATHQEAAAIDSAGTTPKVHRYAPDGVVFLTKPVTVTTGEGVFHFKPGTKLVKVGQSYFAEGQQVPKPSADQVTNDIDLGEQLQKQNSAAPTVARPVQQDGGGATGTPHKSIIPGL
jgi:hypothetical protein